MTTETFNWVEAKKRMKEGKFVARQEWLPHQMYIWYLPAEKVPSEFLVESHVKTLAERNGGYVEFLETIRMKRGDNKILTGWIPHWDSVSAEDWVEVHP
jgi:hypothetical protein